MRYTTKCIDCECIIDEIGKEGDIIVCPDCGLEYELRDGVLVQLVLDAEDWGELVGLFKLKGEFNCYRKWKRQNTQII